MKYFKFSIISIIIIIPLIISSCGNSVRSGHYTEFIINDNDSCIVRGSNMFEKPDDIKKNEDNKALVAEYDNSIEYSYSSKKIKEMTVIYFFDSNGMFQTEINTEFFKESDAAVAVSEIIAYFTDKYGNPEKEQNIFYWDIYNKKTSIDINSQNINQNKIKFTFSYLE